MPIVGVNRDKLFEALGETFTEDGFQNLCFEYGIELDDVTSEKEMLRKELASGDAAAALAAASEEVIFKIDIPANRYDMLCLEGIARALNVFRGRAGPPAYALAPRAPGAATPTPVRITVRPETALVRPFIVAAVLRGVALDAARYASLIDLQDKLHQNLCRQRSLVAIGTHDLATLRAPFTYEALPPADVAFVPLKQDREWRADELLAHYAANDQKLRRFVPLLAGSLVVPVVLDADRRVASLPPVINGARSAISLATRDILIECTATDLAKAKVVLNTVVAMFSGYAAVPFQVEPVEVVDAFGASAIYPDLAPRLFEVPVAYINARTGLDLDAPACAALLARMQLGAAPINDGAALRVEVPASRSDVLHACDVMEDVAIAYGFNNLPVSLPPASGAGRELPLAQLCEALRAEVAAAGFTEVLTWALCSRAECFASLRLEDDPEGAVAVGNPATAEFEIVRTSLLPGALKTLGANKDAPLPARLFEVGDVVLSAPGAGVGARNATRLVALHCDTTSSFEVVHGLLNRIMAALGVPLAPGVTGGPGAGGPDEARWARRYGGAYEWRAEDAPAYFPGRHAAVYARGARVGSLGIVHPEVLAAFDVAFPVAALELDLEPFVFDQAYSPLPTRLEA